jgi:SurA N-terminal domain/PPIC-type PPIASE domain
MWESPGVLKRRAPRVLLSGFLLAAAVSGLTACRTSPNVAAYVGDEQVTVTELENAVARRLEDPLLAAFAAEQPDQFTRQVLSLLVQAEVHEAAAERYGVQVDDDDVRRRIQVLLAGSDADAQYGQLAQRGIGRADVFATVRQQLVRQGIAESEGKAEPPTEADLRARYEEVRDSIAQVSFGYITVPDEATAAAVLAQLTADPASYPAVAAQYPTPTTLATLETRAPDAVPPPLAEGIAAAEPNTGFSLAIPETGGVVVTFVEGPVYPAFEDVRPQLEQEAAGEADVAGGELVDAVQADLGVTVNPRYGVLEEGRLVPGEGGVVDFLEEDAAAAPAGADAPGN